MEEKKCIYQVGCLNDIGCYDEKNDDRGLINDYIVKDEYYETCTESPFCAVFDGVGGEAYGDEAAELAAHSFAEADCSEMGREDIEKAVLKAHLKILAEQAKDVRKTHMATTVAGLYLDENGYMAFNVGDSRIYRYRKPYIAQISTDHTVDEMLRNMGLIPDGRSSHVITRCLGGRKYQPDIYDGTGKIMEDDIFLLTSDGISDVLSHSELERLIENAYEIVKDEGVMRYAVNMRSLCHNIVSEAIRKGSRDNLTIIVVKKI